MAFKKILFIGFRIIGKTLYYLLITAATLDIAVTLYDICGSSDPRLDINTFSEPVPFNETSWSMKKIPATHSESESESDCTLI